MEKISKWKIALIALMVVLSIALFVFKDQIKYLNPSNQVSREILSSHVKTTAKILSLTVKRGKKNAANNIYHIEYKDQKGNVYKANLWYNSIITLKDSVVIYYDPQDPTNITSERSYKEIM